MDAARALEAVGSGERGASFEIFARSLDPQWIEAALAATGSASVRRRKLPAEQVVWIVIGMGLFRDRSIQEVVHHLDLVLPGRAPGARRPAATSSGVVQARDRLGAAPLKALFEQTAARWAGASADAHRWRGLSLYGGRLNAGRAGPRRRTRAPYFLSGRKNSRKSFTSNSGSSVAGK